ncbi:flagellar biosynthesis protein FlhF [Desulfogranum japonicum]|uniref:flagellar biosynthesis protein FlhF n=1 Tax=Desulfogranum japonicum TaxID=231447 RepID=UPI000404AE82|nr:flagellar biosynthesis protein FlhF [Desulfogranum japonicum]
MQVKVFEAPDMATGLKKVKETFGPDALILSTRTIRRGKLGLMSKPILEITAAIDTTWKPQKPARPSTPKPVEPAPQVLADDDLTYDNLWKPKQETNEKKSIDFHRENTVVQDELAELRGIIQSLTKKVADLQPQQQEIRKPYIEPEFAGKEEHNDPIFKLLRSCDINITAARRVAWHAQESMGYNETISQAEMESLVKATLARMITTEKILQHKSHRQQRISLIGPTGVGKTTTIAKLAANYLCRFGGKVGLITIDTYRIAAVEQLKVYGEIMGLPVEVVLKPEELEQAFAKFEHFDLILIDTAGRSPKNKQDLNDMGRFLRPRFNIEHHLMLSATTRDREIYDIIDKFSILPVKTFIFSKIDECERLGVILNTHVHNNTPISFFTNGQRVPEDIVSPNPKVVADYIMNDHRIRNNG